MFFYLCEDFKNLLAKELAILHNHINSQHVLVKDNE